MTAKRLQNEEQHNRYKRKLGQRCAYNSNKIKQKKTISQTPTSSASAQNQEPSKIKEDIRMVKEGKHAANVLQKGNVRIDNSRITDNTTIHKRKTHSEAVKDKETEKHDGNCFNL